MEIQKTTNKKLGLMLELLAFMFFLITYNYLSRETLLKEKVIIRFMDEFSISLNIMIIIRIILVIITVLISLYISSFVIIIFFNKFENIEFNKNKLKTVIYQAFFSGMIVNYFILSVLCLIGKTANLNIVSIVSYALISIALEIMLRSVMHFRIRNILIVSIVYFLLNAGAAIFELI